MKTFSTRTRRRLAAHVVLLGLSTPCVAGTVERSGEPAATASCWPGEAGTDPALCPPNDPRFGRHWEFRGDIPDEIDRSRMHPNELALGAIGFSLDRAWQLSLGRDDVLIAVLDSGIRWAYEDLVNKLYLNRGELPRPQGATSHDANGDGVFDIRDYADDPRVGDRNDNGLLDPEDLILVFSDCVDDDGNGYADDISGYDFFGGSGCDGEAGDNNPRDATDFGHGTGIAGTAAAEANNGIRDPGVCPRCRILPVRVGDSFVVDANRFARGVSFAVHAGATVIASALGSYNNTPAARAAIDLAYERGVPIVASAADEFSYHHNYPSVYNHTLYVNSIRYNHTGDWRKASTFWGVNPCTNFGARVWLSVPATSCSSGATSRLAGVVGLVQSAALDHGHGTLHAEEVYQLLRATADDLDNRTPDWGRQQWPARPGFDQYYGYGRLNAHRAVAAVQSGKIPSIVDLHGPPWFSVISPTSTSTLPVEATIRLPRSSRATWELGYALGVEPSEDEYVSIGKGEAVGDRSGLVGVLDFTRLPLPRGPAPRGRSDRDRFSVTIRLRIEDDRGLVSEARRSFFLVHDETMKRHFPLDLGASGEAGPTLVDLDDDGRDEIVLPTADGRLHILRWEEHGLRSLIAPLDELPPDPHLGSVGVRSIRETVIRGVAVGDLTGEGRPSIVLATRDGSVHAFTDRGERRGGFPVRSKPGESGSATPKRVVETGFLTRPVLANIDGRPGDEILAAGLDGRLYAFRHDGAEVPGFPVTLTNAARPDERAKLVSTPALADLDGDGRKEIVLGSNGLREGLASVYAVRSVGSRHPDGPFLPGWAPFELEALRPDLLPTLANGVHMTPLIVDLDGDGDHEAAFHAVTGTSVLVVDHTADGPRIVRRLSMSAAPGSELETARFLGGTGSGLVADTDHDGSPEIYATLLPFRMLTLRAKPGVPLDVPTALGGWDLGPEPVDGVKISMMETYPRRMEDLMIFAGPAAADVDGDGLDEVLMGSGGYLLHAFRRGGGEAPGFPKFTGGWIFSEPAVGDLDGDHRCEVVTVTREGYLFAWECPATSLTARVPPPGSSPPAGSNAAPGSSRRP